MTWSEIHRRVIKIVGPVCLYTAGTVWAQVPAPPRIDVIAALRTVEVDVSFDGDELEDDSSSTISGPFVRTASAAGSGPLGSSAHGAADQASRISVFFIRGDGAVSAQAALGGDESSIVAANVRSEIGVQFQVPVEAGYRLTGTFEATGPGAPFSFATVQFVGLRPEGPAFFDTHSFNADDPPEEAGFEFEGRVAADTDLTLQIYAQASPEGTEDSPDGLGNAMASFSFRLEFGGSDDPSETFDADQDGLLDSWEEEGIDFDGDGQPEIDLPGLGATSGQRDILVEIDVMDGVPFDQTAVDAVIRAFADAPVGQAGTGSDEPGINLIVLVDSDQPALQQLQQLPNGSLPPEYYDVKDAFFGTADDRSHPDWDQIRPLRLGIFRYCLWGDTIADSDGNRFSGLAEAIPSNDFFVAGAVRSWFADAADATNGLAGTFMHELGHAIGLFHGGAAFMPNFKPNYLSVMNYAYQLPNVASTPQGTNAREAWRLDYSRTDTRTLDEAELVEGDGLDGPEGRMILFNSAAEGLLSTINIEWANSAEIDWNNSMTPDVDPYPLDITNLRNDPASYDVLSSYTDWNRLWIETDGSDNFNDRQPWPYAERVFEGISRDSFMAIQDAEWTDHTALDELVFTHGFELGSTTAWSDTVP